jgi:hypothetical protein
VIWSRAAFDVDDPRPRGEPRERLLEERERGDDVDLINAPQLVERVIGQRRLRARPELARVIDD